MTPSVLPMAGVISRAVGGTARTAASGTATTTSGYDPSIIAKITSTSIGGSSFGCATPTVVDVTSAADSFACSDVGSGITSIAGCAATFERRPLSLTDHLTR